MRPGSLRVVHVFTAFALLGAALLVLNRAQPFVRNELVYARAAGRVIEYGYDPRPVVANSALSYDKPIGFAWLGAPLVRAFGTHVGLRLASYFGTLLYLLAASRFVRALGAVARLELAPAEAAAALALCAFNPITAYQVWSAYPDSLFAALVLAAWTATMELVRAPERAPSRRAAWVALALVAGLVFKNYALVLFACVPLYVLLHARALWRREPRPWRMAAALAAALAACALFAWSGRAGHNPLVRIVGEGGGAELFGRGELVATVAGALLQVVLSLALNLGAALLFVPRRANARFGLVAAALAFGGPYVAGLMVHPATYYNMRYFLPLLPLAAVAGVHGARAARPAARRAAFVAQAAIASALVLAFDVASVNALAEPAIPKLVYARGLFEQGLLDNLRMGHHRARAADLALMNASVEPNGALYLIDCHYYKDALHGVYEAAGLLRPDIVVRYVDAGDLRPAEARFWAWTYYTDRDAIAGLGRLTQLGPDFYRVDRASEAVAPR
ncbi:MAG TPA: hypothetical protein VFS00_12495 [Polyangiaceae bacterium]|nr:hypothetical protein [Polyangiaceae bacterium]